MTSPGNKINQSITRTAPANRPRPLSSHVSLAGENSLMELYGPLMAQNVSFPAMNSYHTRQQMALKQQRGEAAVGGGATLWASKVSQL